MESKKESKKEKLNAGIESIIIGTAALASIESYKRNSKTVIKTIDNASKKFSEITKKMKKSKRLVPT